jgi:hypothetical protein
LREAWPRPWVDRDDREAMQAYAVACREVGHDAIMNAARAWVAAADAPRFLPKLSDWLRAQGYVKDPPQKRTARAPRQHSGNGSYRKGKPDLGRMMMAIQVR